MKKKGKREKYLEEVMKKVKEGKRRKDEEEAKEFWFMIKFFLVAIPVYILYMFLTK